MLFKSVLLLISVPERNAKTVFSGGELSALQSVASALRVQAVPQAAVPSWKALLSPTSPA